MMLEGITVLEVITSGRVSSAGFLVIAIGCILFGCAVAFEAIDALKHKQYKYAIGMYFVIISCIFSLCFAWCDSKFQEARYIVNIDDRVNFNEFHKMYRIVDSRGDTYTIVAIPQNN